VVVSLAWGEEAGEEDEEGGLEDDRWD
jgi:hypothetical protein